MDSIKLKFLLIMPLAASSLIIMTLANKGIEFTVEMGIIAGIVSAVIGIIVLLILKRKQIEFAKNIKEKPKGIADSATRMLCGFKQFIAYSDYIIFESPSGKLTGHAYIVLDSIPYGIEQMDKDTQFSILSSFSRLLGTFNHPFTYMPICRPVNRKKFMDSMQKQIHNIRIGNSVSKVADPKQEIEEKRLMELLRRLTEGENPMELLWIVQIRETRKNVPEIRAKLESHTESMIDSLSVIHSVTARRLYGAEMIEAVQNYFMLGV